MKTFCRILAALLVALMMVSALAACGGNEKTQKPDDSSKPATESTGDEATSNGETTQSTIKKPVINETFGGEVIIISFSSEA